jgi:hypothetical protein
VTDYDEALRQFRREMLGPMVAHMTDAELDAWMEPLEALAASAESEYPEWFVKRRDEARVALLRVLQERAMVLYAREVAEVANEWLEHELAGGSVFVGMLTIREG